ncbi:MAG: S1-C subfamily serine protease [Lentimonas sp.]|jgi:S1-C subfamily serine protease
MILRCFFLFLIFSPDTLRAAAPEQAVVQIINFAQQPNWIEPWRSTRVAQYTGSGFVIDGERIMTNAHVVSWSKQILVRRHQDPKLYPAKIEYIGHDCDLAVLKVLDPAFYDGLEPLAIGTLPKVRSAVTTYGYPAGGQQISYTQGVISRIEVQRYAHIHNRSLLTVQTDAAINPGNSGGPALQGNLVVGVSFQGNPSLENAGFFIPPTIIRHFLKDIEDGSYAGFPDAGISTASLHNPAFRKALKLPDNNIGVRIDMLLHPFPQSHELLRENDVILEVEGYEVGSDSMIQYEGNRIHVSILFDTVQHGESLNIAVWRDGQALNIDLPVYKNNADRISGSQYDTPPPYLIIGGIVFTELSNNYCNAYGKDWLNNFSNRALYQLLYRAFQDEAGARATPIVLSKVLKHPSNIDFGVYTKSILTKLNGQEIHSMKDLLDAQDASEDDFHRFEFLSGRVEALRRDAAEQANAELLQTYQIPHAHRIEAHND